MGEPTELERLAGMVGIEPEYWDIWGNHNVVTPDSKRRLLAALGFAADTDEQIAASIRRLQELPWRKLLPPVLVARDKATVIVPMSMPATEAKQTFWCLIDMEDGTTRRLTFLASDLPCLASAPVDGLVVDRRALTLPFSLPLGYHGMRIGSDDGQLTGHMRLIIAPERCHLPEGMDKHTRKWGISTHLYSLKDNRDWGIGDFSGLARLASVSARAGAAMIGLNPLHALFLEYPDRASPYSPSSRVFLNPLYLDVEAIPDFAESAEAQAAAAAARDDVAELRARTHVDYPAVAALKMAVLELLFEHFRRVHLRGDQSSRGMAFNRFCDEQGEALQRFAVFEALSERFTGVPWQQWPEAYRDPASAQVARFVGTRLIRVQFFKYLQWQTDVQLAAAQQACIDAGLSIGLYRDLAVGCAIDGADAWIAQDVITEAAKVGCPPDPFNMLGQDWGTPPLNPIALYYQAYQPFIDIVRSNMRHAGALRIDHVMAIQHLFWIPKESSPAGGAYISYPFNDLLAILALESQRQQCIVVGEDLGTVPVGFRERMAACGVLSYRVLYFEKDGDRFKRPDEYPRLALACITTHDLATLNGFWSAADVDLKRRLNLYPSADAERSEYAARARDRDLLLAALAGENLLPDGVNAQAMDGQPMPAAVAAALHQYLSCSPAGLMLVQIDDITGENEQLNLPGTVDERPNWRRRLSVAVDALDETPMMSAIAAALADRRD